jgi:hypothetical protein
MRVTLGRQPDANVNEIEDFATQTRAASAANGMKDDRSYESREPAMANCRFSPKSDVS